MARQIILIAGTTASGKSALALELARRLEAVIVNADALQVYAKWQVLTARPTAADMAQAPHELYGYVDEHDDYSVGHWLRAVTTLLEDSKQNLIIVGGTGLYFSALLNGLSEIPAIPLEIRQAGNDHRTRDKGAYFLKVLKEKNPVTLEKIDINNPVRLQRAWEVLVSTGHGLDYWHSRPTRAPLALANTTPLLLNSETDHTNARIDLRFDQMMQRGAIAECEAAAAGFDPHLPANRAIGAREIIAAIHGETSFEAAATTAKILTRQYAKRQRTWFKSKMKGWGKIEITPTVNLQVIAGEVTTVMR